jgi:hypothetical protein
MSSVTIPPGQLEMCESLVNVVNDNNYEMSEDVDVTISESSIPELVTVGNEPSVTITIVDPEGNYHKGGL